VADHPVGDEQHGAALLRREREGQDPGRGQRLQRPERALETQRPVLERLDDAGMLDRAGAPALAVTVPLASA